jgi:hypothetical protein
MSEVRRRLTRRACAVAAAILACSGSAGSILHAQSVTSGALRGMVVHTDGSGVSGAAITIEIGSGGTFREIESRDDGMFTVAMMLPGRYNILVEIEGYQPVRHRGVIIAAGRTTTVAITLVEKPPPITSVTEIDQPGITTGGLGRVLSNTELMALEVRHDLTDLARLVTEVVQPFSGWGGFGLAASGLPASSSRLFVDGVPESLLRHPRVPRDPPSTPAFALHGTEQAQLLGSTPDGEWRGVAGTILSAQSRSGQNRLRFAPFASWSGSQIGGKLLDNPGDSSATSLQLGATVSGALKPDTAHFFLRAEYQSLEMPTAFPWEADSSRFQGAAVSLRAGIPTVGADVFGTPLEGAVAPVVRTWKGGSVGARVDWQVGRSSAFMLRSSFASWKETNAGLGWDAGNDQGASLSARDISLAMSLVTVVGDYSNEARAGLWLSRREWSQTGGAETRFVGEGVRIGGNAALPGLFDTKSIGISDAFQWSTGGNTIKAGVSVDLTSYRQDYQYGAAGIFQFGDLDRFGTASGTYFISAPHTPTDGFTTLNPGVFIQDTYSLSSGLQLLFGARYDVQLLPQDKMSRNAAWVERSGLRGDTVFKDRRGIQPRLGFVLNPGNRGTWVFQGDLGLHSTGVDLVAYSEAIGNSGGVNVRRGLGTLGSWPATPSDAAAPFAGERLTLLTGGENFRSPRTLKGQLGLTGSLGQGLLLQVAGSYHHTDFLLRRTDLNRPPGPSRVTQEGREVFGALVQQGGQLAVVPKSSRRFEDFDLVSALSPTGFSDHYELTASLQRQVARSLSLTASYTFSRTRDNLVGLLQVDPADQLSPFPGSAWEASRSDLDIPHRVVAVAEFRGGGRMPVTLAARARWRSGLPFTPGFRPGVDINGDLGGNNDPVAAGDAVTVAGSQISCDGSSVGGFAARNSCREKGIGAVDLRFSLGIPAGGARLALTLDAFNLVASSTGVIDQAAILIDPTGSITESNGVITLPFLANPRFGRIASRRTEPRLLRVGLRMEY